jgi:hypothetical protein
MRKLMLAVMALIGFTLSTTAQQAPKKAPAAKTETKAPLKKDGTPDKRFKDNKTPKGPLKKEGTPDKRFKENKK